LQYLQGKKAHSALPVPYREAFGGPAAPGVPTAEQLHTSGLDGAAKGQRKSPAYLIALRVYVRSGDSWEERTLVFRGKSGLQWGTGETVEGCDRKAVLALKHAVRRGTLEAEWVSRPLLWRELLSRALGGADAMLEEPAPRRGRQDRYDRAELLRTHLRKPRIAPRRLELFCRWLACLGVGPEGQGHGQGGQGQLQPEVLPRAMADGLLLCKLMKRLLPDTTFRGLHRRPLSHQGALHNLEEGLGLVWRKGHRVNCTHMPSAEELYHCHPNKAARLLAEVFEAFVMRPLRARTGPMLRWVDAVLRLYQRPLRPHSLQAPFKGLWESLQDGVGLFCLIFHFCGPTLVGGRGESRAYRKVDPRRVLGAPRSIDEYRHNVREVMLLLQALGINVPWTVDMWITYPDKVCAALAWSLHCPNAAVSHLMCNIPQDFVLYQLKLIYEHFEGQECALPEVEKPIPGVVGLQRGQDGEARVVGLSFARELEPSLERTSSAGPSEVRDSLPGGSTPYCRP
jgi:hypothetical protein